MTRFLITVLTMHLFLGSSFADLSDKNTPEAKQFFPGLGFGGLGFGGLGRFGLMPFGGFGMFDEEDARPDGDEEDLPPFERETADDVPDSRQILRRVVAQRRVIPGLGFGGMGFGGLGYGIGYGGLGMGYNRFGMWDEAAKDGKDSKSETPVRVVRLPRRVWWRLMQQFARRREPVRSWPNRMHRFEE